MDSYLQKMANALKSGISDQWQQGAPYRQALAGALQGDFHPADKLFNTPQPVDPMEAVNVAMTFAPMGLGTIGKVGHIDFGIQSKIMNKNYLPHIDDAISSVKEWIAAGKPNHNWADGGALAKKATNSINNVLERVQKPTDGTFWRGTNNPDEITHLNNGGEIISKNHIDGNNELGMSVSSTPATLWAYGYKHAYKVRGDVVGKGSDGEPILKNVKPESDMHLASDVINNDIGRANAINTIEHISKNTGLSPEIISWLAYR